VHRLTFGVYGPPGELAAFRATVDDWNATSKGPRVDMLAWRDRSTMRSALTSGGKLPDVFLTSRSDLAWLLENHYTQPVDELLDERGVNFGDDYSRDALQAFSTDARLQCMPYAVSPLVVFYNTSLVNFDRMRKRGLDAPAEGDTGWSFDQFAAAARFAARPARGTKGVHVSPTLSGLAPFIESGGGSLFDDGGAPTSLSFSSDGSKAALGRTLELLRNPQLTLDDEELQKASALTWFKRGKLGMITGYRSLVPELRQVPGLNFDVMEMPALGSNSTTVGDVAGLCLSKNAASTPLAADFMVHELSADAVSRVAQTGYLAPANLQVALSDAFLQPGRAPANAQAFNSSVRAMRFYPLIDTMAELERAVQPDLDQLVYGVGALDLDAVTQKIDAESKLVLDPEDASGSPSPSDSPSG
jgi:multiple sugar transport system substrate-binding protein